MHITRVMYTVKPEYVEANKKNIEAVMQEVKSMHWDGFKYATFLGEDGLSFMHLAIAESREVNDRLLTLSSFKFFSSELRAKGLENPPKSEHLGLVAAGYDIFG